ncbi:heavy-metal-associated domain-containing protein [bacterium]|nr:MAG: heavy-metal-associated domain-containing protein [bacterium]
MTQTISVAGMTCENCVRHVTEALQALPGVRSVRVDLRAGAATMDVERPLELDVVAHTLDEEGYELVR